MKISCPPEALALIGFAATLTGCVVLHIPILYALVAGYGIFSSYALLKKYPPRQVLAMSVSGIRTVKNILIVFVLIGMLTAIWRASGTIPAIVGYSADLIRPSGLVLTVFLLNTLVSVLTGTSFGTAATMGVICMTMAATMGVSPVLTGGAVLAGAFFGDRCSPVSTSALLVATLTRTDIFGNIRLMLRTALVPFLLSCAVYLVMGFVSPHEPLGDFDARALFAGEFRMGWVALLPALLILALSILKINVKTAMLASIACAFIICLAYERMELSRLLRALVFGYRSSDPGLAPLIDGGGIGAMLNAICIVCLSSTYAGIFEGTGLLNHLKGRIEAASRRISVFGGILGTSVVASMIACNQSLAIILTHQLCATVEKDRQRFAIDLENSAVVIAPLIPWSVAGAVPLASISAPASALFAACFLYLLPMWHLLASRRRG